MIIIILIMIIIIILINLPNNIKYSLYFIILFPWGEQNYEMYFREVKNPNLFHRALVFHHRTLWSGFNWATGTECLVILAPFLVLLVLFIIWKCTKQCMYLKRTS